MAWYEYRDRQEQEAAVARQIAKKRKKGEPFVPVEAATTRGAIATTFWGKAWCTNLETYSDYESRLPRGRTYLRKGNVYDLEISEGSVFAYVAGSNLYEVEITIDPLLKKRWTALRKSIAGEISNLVDLLGNNLGAGVMGLVTDPKNGLFPEPKEIQINCNCPDWAGLCKHAAAVLYGVGARLDQQPDLLFLLRGTDHTELVSAATGSAAGLTAPLSPHTNALAPDDLSELFGIELAEPEAAFPELP